MIIGVEETKTGGMSQTSALVRISRKAKKGDAFRLKRGLYTDDPQESLLRIANALMVPSYVSFEYALSFHGLIPEAVFEVTSASLWARGQPTFINHFGRFSYRNVPLSAYQYGLIYVDQAAIASAEKALCDLLHTLPSVRSSKQLESLLFEDLRIDEYGFEQLNMEDLRELASLYPGDTFRVLSHYIERKI